MPLCKWLDPGELASDQERQGSQGDADAVRQLAYRVRRAGACIGTYPGRYVDIEQLHGLGRVAQQLAGQAVPERIDHGRQTPGDEDKDHGLPCGFGSDEAAHHGHQLDVTGSHGMQQIERQHQRQTQRHATQRPEKATMVGVGGQQTVEQSQGDAPESQAIGDAPCAQVAETGGRQKQQQQE